MGTNEKTPYRLFTALLIITKWMWSNKEGIAYYSKLFISPVGNNISIIYPILNFSDEIMVKYF